jgi:hypothetical protein
MNVAELVSGGSDSEMSNKGMNRTRNQWASHPQSSVLAGYPRRCAILVRESLMKMNSLARRILILATLICTVTACATAAPQSATTDTALRRAIIRELGDEYSGEFRFVSRQVDLNGDGRSEVLAWVPTIGYGGTSGYPLLIFQRNRRGYRLLSAIEQVWTPLIVLRSSSGRGWRDIVMQEGGGGVEMHYILLRHSGRSYTKSETSAPGESVIARGHMLIGREWRATTFGPIPR